LKHVVCGEMNETVQRSRSLTRSKVVVEMKIIDSL
jgi:hypothetical protein